MCLSFLIYYPRSAVSKCLSDPTAEAGTLFYSKLKWVKHALHCELESTCFSFMHIWEVCFLSCNQSTNKTSWSPKIASNHILSASIAYPCMWVAHVCRVLCTEEEPPPHASILPFAACERWQYTMWFHLSDCIEIISLKSTIQIITGDMTPPPLEVFGHIWALHLCLWILARTLSR